MPSPRKDKDTRILLHLLLEGWGRKRVCRTLGWSVDKYRHHVQKLKKAKAIILTDQAFGTYRRGPNAQAWEDPTPSEQRGQPEYPTPPPEPDPAGRIPDPGYRLVEGARFRFRVLESNGPALKTYALANGVRVHRRRISTDLGPATAQLYNDRTLLLSFAKVPFDVDLIPRLNDILYQGALDARRRLSRALHIQIALPEPIPDRKARQAEVPLLTGELVKPFPGYEETRGRQVIDATTEINGSPPGLCLETADLLIAQADAQLPSRLVALEKVVGQMARERDTLVGLMEKQNAYLEVLGRNIERLTEILGAMEDHEPAGPGPEVR
ncbi:MAG: hypothetical protein ACE5JJ_12395 [Nitrospinota bacterium]